jgi:hypothetical protein
MNNNALVTIGSRWEFELIRNGKRVWRDGFDNLVTTAGLNKLLDATFLTGLATPTWYVGLVASSPSFAAADTASSHAGWTEDTNYAAAVRPTFTMGTIAAGSGSNSASKASVTFSSGTTISGAFLIDSSVKAGTSGTLYAEGSFSGGNQAVIAGDVMNITVTLTVQSGTVAASSFMPIKEESFGEYHP